MNDQAPQHWSGQRAEGFSTARMVGRVLIALAITTLIVAVLVVVAVTAHATDPTPGPVVVELTPAVTVTRAPAPPSERGQPVTGWAVVGILTFAAGVGVWVNARRDDT